MSESWYWCRWWWWEYVVVVMNEVIRQLLLILMVVKILSVRMIAAAMVRVSFINNGDDGDAIDITTPTPQAT